MVVCSRCPRYRPPSDSAENTSRNPQPGRRTVHPSSLDEEAHPTTTATPAHAGHMALTGRNEPAVEMRGIPVTANYRGIITLRDSIILYASQYTLARGTIYLASCILFCN